MPIEAPSGTLDIENAKLRVSEFSATTSIGIGTENTEKYPLYIYNDVKPEIIIQESSTSAAKFTSNNGSLTIQSGITLSDSSDGDIVFSDMGGITKHMTIKGATGYIGVGTTSPSAKLHVNGGSLKISSGSSGGLYDNGYQWLECKNASDWYRLAQTPKSSGIACYNGIAINSGGGLVVGSWDSPNTLGVGNAYFAGNVGIGILSPAYKLDVNGTLRASNAYFANMYIGGSTSRGLRSVSGSYGTVQTTGGGAGNYEGYSIDGRYVFMSADNNGCGIYNDLDNEWMIFCARNSHTTLYFDGGEKLATTTTGVSITGDIAVSSNLTVGTANLHVDTLTGRVGVGTNTPGYTLDVNGTVNTGALTATSGTFSGNVGIGVTSPGVKLDIAATSAYTPAIRFGTNTTYDDGQLYSLAFGGSTLMGMGLYSSTRTVFGAQGLGIHIPNTEEFSIRSNSWAKLFALDGATNKAYFGGNVGIGTTSPNYKLDVNGDINFTGTLYENGVAFSGGGGGGGSSVWGTSGTSIYYNSGNVGVGVLSPTYKLHVVGDIYASGDVIMFSDERKKTNIEVISNALEKVLQMRGVTFEKLDDGNRRHSGIIAQDVEKVLPEVVYTAEDGTKSVAYGNMIGIIIEAIKELSRK